MLRKFFATLLILAFVGCTPSYATNGALTPMGCDAVVKASKDILSMYRGGDNQFQVFEQLNYQPRSYWNNDEVAKVYTQTIVIDLQKNFRKGFSDAVILKTVKTSCESKLGMSI